jgi:hypothetical protein
VGGGVGGVGGFSITQLLSENGRGFNGTYKWYC